MKIKLTLLALAVASPAYGIIVVQENFDYANGDVDLYNGGTGWVTAWENGNSDASRRFIVSGNTALYQGSGSGTTTRQNRNFSSNISVGVNDTVTVEFTLLRNETQLGRGIGIELTLAGAGQYFIGKEINDNVGLKAGIAASSANYAVFGTSGTAETITATFTYDGANTSIVMADSNETLTTYTHSGAFTFDGISLVGYHGSTVNNGIDDISIDVTTIPEPSSTALLGLGGLALILRRRK